MKRNVVLRPSLYYKTIFGIRYLRSSKEKFENTKVIIRRKRYIEGQTIHWPKEKGILP